MATATSPAAPADRTAAGVLLAFASYASFSCSDAAIRLLHGAIDPFELAFLGALLGLAALPFVRQPGERWGDLVRVERPWLWIGRAAGTAVSTVTSVIAFTDLPMPEAFALIFLMPLFVTILSVLFLHEHVGRWRWAAVCMGFVGVLVVLRPGFRALSLGHAAAVAAGLSTSVAVLMVRLGGGRETALATYGAGLAGPLFVNGLLMLPHIAVPSESSVPLILAYGLLAAAGQALLLLAAQRASANRIASPQYSQMLWAVWFGAVLFHEPVDRATVLGIAIIMAAGVLTWARERRLRARPAGPLIP